MIKKLTAKEQIAILSCSLKPFEFRKGWRKPWMKSLAQSLRNRGYKCETLAWLFNTTSLTASLWTRD